MGALDSVKSRADQHVSLRFTYVCAAAALFLCRCFDSSPALAIESQVPQPQLAAEFPVASDVRISGDNKQTRFVMDLDRKINVRAFTLAEPYRVVLDVPQVDFQLAPDAG